MTGLQRDISRLETVAASYALMLFVFLLPPSILARDEKPPLHNWRSVEYANLLTQTDNFLPPIPSLVNNANTLTHQTSFDLHLSFYIPSVNLRLPGGPPPESSKIRVRLHSENGAVQDPKSVEQLVSVDRGNSRAVNYSYSFPWGRNVMEGGWLEVSIAGQTYWLEVPYGFTRNPADPLPTGGQEHRKPSLIPAIKNLGTGDRIVHWSYVHYPLGVILNGWQLDLQLSNPGDARAEVILYREDSQIGKSMFLWDLHSPRTTFAIERSGRVLESICIGIRLHGDGMRRSDSFLVNRDIVEARCWGRAIIKVDKATYRCVVPSSLFLYQHGQVRYAGTQENGE